TARLRYRRNVDDAYAPVQRLNRMLSQAGALAAVEEQLTALDQVLRDGGAAEAAERFQQAESLFSDFDEINHVRSALSSIRRAINDDGFDREHASAALGEALELYRREVDWR